MEIGRVNLNGFGKIEWNEMRCQTLGTCRKMDDLARNVRKSCVVGSGAAQNDEHANI